MLRKILLLCVACFIMCGCISCKNEDLDNVNVQEIYFDNIETLICSQSNPNYDLILEQVEAILKQNSVTPTIGVFEHEPEITLVCENGVVYEITRAISDANITYIGGDETEETYISFCCIRKMEDGEKTFFAYYEQTKAVETLFGLKADAIAYEYTSGTINSVIGVVVGINLKGNYTEYVIDSTEYGRVWLTVDDTDCAIVGDTVSYEVTSVDSDSGWYYGTIDNLTENDVTQTTAEYITVFDYEYSIMVVPKEPEMLDVAMGRVETEDDAEYFDFILSLYDDRLPENVIQELDEKYDETFFQEHILLYYGMEVKDVEVTAVVWQKWIGGENEVYIKELTGVKVPENEHRILLIEVPREDWNGHDFSGYVY